MYDELLAALRATGLPLAEWAWEGQDGPPRTDYLVVALDGQGDSLWADAHMAERALEGSIDLFAYTDGRNNAAAVESALNSIDCAWYLSSIQLESDTGLLHYEWIFQMCTAMAHTAQEASNAQDEA